MKRYLLALLLLLAPSAAQAIQFVPQTTVTTSMDTAVTANTACDDDATDYSTTTPAAFPCRNTGALYIYGFDQQSVQVEFTRSAGTTVTMHCRTSENATTGPWYTIQLIDSTGSSTGRPWTKTRSLSGGWTWNFTANASYIMCWFRTTAGGSNDKLKLVYRIASSEPGVTFYKP
jgi:hypothetical protein